jgi:exosome complex RNA-binding protein Csl4
VSYGTDEHVTAARGCTVTYLGRKCAIFEEKIVFHRVKSKLVTSVDAGGNVVTTEVLEPEETTTLVNISTVEGKPATMEGKFAMKLTGGEKFGPFTNSWTGNIRLGAGPRLAR